MAYTQNPTSAKKAAFHRALQRWYETHGRHSLPWRNTSDAYAIYISEIMLQQTQVKTVLEHYYTPFLKAFPTLKKLAQADKQAVIKQWEGLGYYTRAANMHAAAKQCKGVLPETVEELQKLPGIGRNTANAIACFSYGQAVPIMEANVRRVLCRVFALTQADDKILWKKAEWLLDKKSSFNYNQAMMDIGALICKKLNPSCDTCPLSMICKGKISPVSYPAPKSSKATPIRHRIIVVLRDAKGGYYVRRRESRFLHGLYGFPEYAPDAKYIVYNNQKYPLKKTSIIGQIKQTYSHFTLQAIVHSLPVPMEKENAGDLYRATLKEMQTLPLSRADHKILGLFI